MHPDLINRFQPFTKSPPSRMQAMYECLLAIDADKIPGDVVECGVWCGGNIMLARTISPERTCWLYDTFDGMTIPDAVVDVKRDGERAIDRYYLKLKGGTKWDAVSRDDVVKSFAREGLLDKTVFVEGPIEFSVHGNAPDSIAILRLDMDWHSPTKVALEQLYPKLSLGGFLIIDDYGHWLGCKKAVDDYFAETDRRIDLEQVDYTCYMMRKC